MESGLALKTFLEIFVTLGVLWRLGSFFERHRNLFVLGLLVLLSVLFLEKGLLLRIPHLRTWLLPFEAWFLAVLVFEPELSKGLRRMTKRHAPGACLKNGLLEELVRSCEILSDARTGALLAIEREEDLSSFIRTSVAIDARLRHELLLTIFTPPTYLHDGGIILKGGRIASCSAIFPLSNNPKIKRDLGTRHRAALGMSEETDALCLVVSEESGSISITDRGRLFFDIHRSELKETLERLLDFKKVKHANYLENHETH